MTKECKGCQYEGSTLKDDEFMMCVICPVAEEAYHNGWMDKWSNLINNETSCEGCHYLEITEPHCMNICRDPTKSSLYPKEYEQYLCRRAKRARMKSQKKKAQRMWRNEPNNGKSYWSGGSRYNVIRL
jgi:hypothetical protein